MSTAPAMLPILHHFYVSHRIIECPDLGESHKDHRVQPLALHRTIPKSPMCLGVLPKHSWNSVILGAVATFPDSLLQ